MKAIVDARDPSSVRRIWGMTNLERMLHLLVEQGVTDVLLIRANNSPELQWKNRRLTQRVAVRETGGSLGEALEDVRKSGADVVFLLDGRTVCDRRVLAHLAAGHRSGAVVVYDRRVAVSLIHLDGLHRSMESMPDRVYEASLALIEHPLRPGDLDCYIPALRHRIEPYLIPLESTDDERAARSIMFRLAYKGGLDFIYLYGYRPIVRVIVSLVAPTPITPNQVTIGYLCVALAALPFLAGASFAIGLPLCLLAMIGDATDGVLARLTFQTSRLGHYLDKFSHRIYHSLWYLAIGWGLSGGTFDNPVFWNGGLLVLMYIGSRHITGSFKARHKISIFDITPFDRFFRLIAGARWNVNMLLFTVGLLAGEPEGFFFGMSAWGLFALLFWWSRHFTARHAGSSAATSA
jgi:phosphatidylglycerophosphate synthase